MMSALRKPPIDWERIAAAFLLYVVPALVLLLIAAKVAAVLDLRIEFGWHW